MSSFGGMIKMAKILEITENMISIGMEDNSIKEVRPVDLNFVPHIGDEVEIFETETRTIVQKKEPAQKQQLPEGGIHINVENTQQTPAAASTVVVSGKVVNKAVCCVLALLLGGVGAHKFYAGKIGSGIAYLLFFWTAIPALIAFFEFLGALFKKADAAGNIIV